MRDIRGLLEILLSILALLLSETTISEAVRPPPRFDISTYKYVSPPREVLNVLYRERTVNSRLSEQVRERIDQEQGQSLEKIKLQLVPRVKKISKVVVDSKAVSQTYRLCATDSILENEYRSKSRCAPTFCYNFKYELDRNNLGGPCLWDTKVTGGEAQSVPAYTRCVQVYVLVDNPKDDKVRMNCFNFNFFKRKKKKQKQDVEKFPVLRDACLCVYHDQPRDKLVAYLIHERSEKQGLLSYYRMPFYYLPVVPEDEAQVKSKLEKWCGDDEFKNPDTPTRFEAFFNVQNFSGCALGMMKVALA
ncbi:hypothetical protein M8J77_020154 [Diaphorina citri]|nr:hypothetical protein M8J77_020154 [Diaphorina citri]